MYSRRRFTQFALAAAAAPSVIAKPDSKINGVVVGLQTYSFRDRSLDEAIKATAALGIGHVELWSRHLEPKGATAEQVKKWRTAPSTLQQAKDVARKFQDAGIRIFAFNYSFRKNHSDEEVLHGMEMAKLMGTKYITASSTVDQAERLDRLAGKAGVIVAVHNHAKVQDPNEFATPETFERAMAGHPRIRINLDIGHFIAANYDPIEYLRKNHAKVLSIHIKDRKKNQGENVPLGQGETPIKEILHLIRDNKWPMPVMIEYEYKGADAFEEVRKSYEFLKRALA